MTKDAVVSATLTEKKQSFDVQGTYKLNAGQTSVYRVNYPVSTIRQLGEEIKKGDAGLLKNAADRVGLIADTGNLCVSGEQATSTFLELAAAFANEKNYL